MHVSCNIIIEMHNSIITDAQTVISFLKTYGLDKDFKVRGWESTYLCISSLSNFGHNIIPSSHPYFLFFSCVRAMG